MSSFNFDYSFFFVVFCASFVLPLLTCLPISVSDNPYDKFVDFLSKNNCTMPKEVQLPFPQSSDPSPFKYLDTPLKECQTEDALKENSEANLICREIFDVLQNITCFEEYGSLPKIDSSHLSEDICNDFKTMQDAFPKQDNYLSGKLGDSIICKLLCTTDKYELLCKTLLWSYDTQAKIKNALENEKESINEISSDKVVKVHLVQEKLELASKELTNKNIQMSSDGILQEDKSPHVGSDPHDSKSGLSNLNIVNNPDKDALNETDTSADKNQYTKTSSTTKNVNATVTPKSEFGISKSSQKSRPLEPNSSIKPDQDDMQTDHKSNEIDNNLFDQLTMPYKNVDVKNNTAQVTLKFVTNVNNLTSNNNEVKGNKNVKNVSVDILQNKEINKDNINNDISTKESKKTEAAITPKPEISNKLNAVKTHEQENKSKSKQIAVNAYNDQDKETENSELTDFDSGNKVTPDIDSKFPETSTVQIFTDEDNEPHQDDKDQDQYNDTENEGDYPKAEYDNSFNLPPKNTEPDIKSSISAGSSQISNSYDPFVSQRNNIVRVPDDIQMISSFPEQEDSHFFFYFLSIVLILMAGYLIFHNKQKIIALIVEGRHERRRRSHGAGYKKLETK